MSTGIKILNLLFRPNTFFSQISKEKENLFLPAIIVLLVPITALFVSIFYVISSNPSSFDTVLGKLYYSLTLNFPFLYLGPLLFWAVASISIYATSRMFSGTGSLKVTFQNTGYSILPIALNIALIEFLTKITMIAIEQTGDSAFTAFTNHPLGHLSIILGSYQVFLGFMLWSGYLCVRGTVHAHQIPWVKAIIAVGFGFFMVFLLNLIGMGIMGIY